MAITRMKRIFFKGAKLRKCVVGKKIGRPSIAGDYPRAHAIKLILILLHPFGALVRNVIAAQGSCPVLTNITIRGSH